MIEKKKKRGKLLALYFPAPLYNQELIDSFVSSVYKSGRFRILLEEKRLSAEQKMKLFARCWAVPYRGEPSHRANGTGGIRQ